MVIENYYAICSYLSLQDVGSSVHFSQIVVWYTGTGIFITLHSSPARLDGIYPVQIHLIGIQEIT